MVEMDGLSKVLTILLILDVGSSLIKKARKGLKKKKAPKKAKRHKRQR